MLLDCKPSHSHSRELLTLKLLPFAKLHLRSKSVIKVRLAFLFMALVNDLLL